MTQTKVLNSNDRQEKPKAPPKPLKGASLLMSTSESNSLSGVAGSRQQPEPMQAPSSTSSSGSSGSAAVPMYANINTSNNSSASNTGQTYAQVRAKLRPSGGFYSQFSPGMFISILHVNIIIINEIILSILYGKYKSGNIGKL